MNKRDLSIFVSRALDLDSELGAYLNEVSNSVTCTSLIDFSPVPFSIPETSWLFFYSKSGVRYFFEQLDPDADLENYKFATFGKSTGKYLESKIDRPLDYTGEANTDDIAKALIRKVGESTICFVVGQNSLRSVQSILPPTISKKEIIVYNNQPLQSLPLNHYNIAIITSPMNATTFVKSGGSADHYISIGTTTYNAQQSLNIDSIIAESPSELGIHESVRRLYEEYYYPTTK